MKISVIMPHYKRVKLLNRTLKEYTALHDEETLKRVEFVIIDDGGNDASAFRDVITIHREKLNIFAAIIDEGTCNAVIPYNYGIKQAKGETIILTCCECLPITPNMLNRIYELTTDNTYLSCGCYSLSEYETENLHRVIKLKPRAATFNGDSGWYNHSVHYPRHLNFLTAIKRKKLIELGGFDEDYEHGFWKDDVDLIDRIRKSDLVIEARDHLACLHQWHYDENYGDKKKLIERNNRIYESKGNVPIMSNQGRAWGEPKREIIII